MKKICSFFSRLFSVLFHNACLPITQTRLGFNLEEPFQGLEYESIHKRNLQADRDVGI